MDDYIESLKQRSRQLEIESQYLRDMVSQLTSTDDNKASGQEPDVFIPSFQQQEPTPSYTASPIVRVKLLKPHSHNEFNPFINRVVVLNKVNHVEVVPSKLLKVATTGDNDQNSVIVPSVTEPSVEVVKEPVITVTEPSVEDVKEPVITVAEPSVLIVNEPVAESPTMVVPTVLPKVEQKTSSLLSKRIIHAQPKVKQPKQTMYIHKSTEPKIMFTKVSTNPTPFIKANTPQNTENIKSKAVTSRLPKMPSVMSDSFEIEETIPERISGTFLRPIIHKPRNFNYPSPSHSLDEIPCLSSKFPKILSQYLPTSAMIEHTWLSLDQGKLAVSSVAVFAMYHEYLFKAAPSVLHLYYMARNVTDKTLDVGVTLKDIFWAYKNYGWCHESEWQWNPEMFHMSPVIAKTMEPYILNLYKVEGQYEVQKCIKDKRPVMVSIVVFKDLLEYTSEKTIKAPPPDESPLGTQCFLIVGYTDKVYSCVTSLSKTPKVFNLETTYVHSHAIELFAVY